MYFLTFTCKMGTGGAEMAGRVAEQLGYNFYDVKAIEHAAREMGFMEDSAEVEEKGPSLVARFFSFKNPEIPLNRIKSVVYELASRGSAVFVARANHALLRDLTCALHVGVTASLERRVQNLVACGLQEEEALKAIRTNDHEREAFTKFAFGVDWNNPEHYHIMLNMDKWSTDQAVDMILGLARRGEAATGAVDVTNHLRIMALATRARAALIEAGFSMTTLSLSVPEPGRVHLEGLAYSASEVARARDILQGVRGVESVTTK